MRVYILGKMRGIPYYNFPAFDAAASTLKWMGHAPLSPADIDRKYGFDAMTLPQNFDWHSIPDTLNLRDIVQRDIFAVLFEAEAWHGLEGWEESTGARAEKALCDWLGLPEIKL